ncbi:MAG: hypothetical protein ACI89X_000632 [Planctomycetota bacterium]|jgi:hypothetical protein
MRSLAATALVLGSAVAAAIAPVWTYAITLALFGLPHVLVELRYVDERFAARIPRNLIFGLGVGLAGIVVMRAFGLLGVGSSNERITLELVLGVSLIAVAFPLLRRVKTSPLAIAVGSGLLIGIYYAPAATLVTMALLHNLTPVGFLAERLQGSKRRRAMLLCAIVFGAIPAALLILPASTMLLTGPLSVGHIDDHIGTFVPPALLGTSFADRLFAAAAFLQCMHYAVVMHVLPRLSGGSEATAAVVSWPKQRLFTAAVVTAGLLMTIGFVANFRSARSVYSMFAAVHAWIEIPVLLIACAVLPRSASNQPTTA